jgi:hypothetical protein
MKVQKVMAIFKKVDDIQLIDNSFVIQLAITTSIRCFNTLSTRNLMRCISAH